MFVILGTSCCSLIFDNYLYLGHLSQMKTCKPIGLAATQLLGELSKITDSWVSTLYSVIHEVIGGPAQNV